jgi:hypothetical protein
MVTQCVVILGSSDACREWVGLWPEQDAIEGIVGTSVTLLAAGPPRHQEQTAELPKTLRHPGASR